MCLIISAPKGNQIPLEILEDATQQNSDGWGVMWHNGRSLQVHKDPKPSALAIHDLVKNNPHHTVVHLRMNTHGDNSYENTHPFEIIPNRMYMMHNGVISGLDAPRHLKRSDTRIMVEDYIKPLVTKPGHLNNPGLKAFIQKMIGSSANRLVFLDDTGKLTYFNQGLGTTWKGLWCSNTYAWTLHEEGRRYSYGSKHHWTGYDSSYDYDRWYRGGSSKDDSIAWASRDIQASEDVAVDPKDDDVETQYGFSIPAWLAPFLEAEYDQLTECSPEDLALVIEHLRDNFIGEPM